MGACAPAPLPTPVVDGVPAQTPASAGSSAPTASARPAPEDAHELVARACGITRYEDCEEDALLAMLEFAPGSLVAVCDYEDGTGDVLLIHDPDEAEDACSAGGLRSPSYVLAVVEIP